MIYENSLREVQWHHTKRSMGNPYFVADLVDWTGVKKTVLEEAKGQINQTTGDFTVFGGLPACRKHR